MECTAKAVQIRFQLDPARPWLRSVVRTARVMLDRKPLRDATFGPDGTAAVEISPADAASAKRHRLMLKLDRDLVRRVPCRAGYPVAWEIVSRGISGRVGYRGVTRDAPGASRPTFADLAAAAALVWLWPAQFASARDGLGRRFGPCTVVPRAGPKVRRAGL